MSLYVHRCHPDAHSLEAPLSIPGVVHWPEQAYMVSENFSESVTELEQPYVPEADKDSMGAMMVQ